jgi:hypothetical protein
MDPKEAAAVLTQAMAKANDPAVLQKLAEVLSEVAARMGPEEAARASAEAAAPLTQAMARANTHYDLLRLTRALTALAARMPLEAKARALTEAAVLLTQAMANPNDRIVLRGLAEGLSEVAARMGPEEAARVSAEAAAIFLQDMARPPRYIDLQELTEIFSTLLSGGWDKERATAAAAVVGCPGALLLSRSVGPPQTRRFSDRELVELLKQPLCVGPARRLVLDQLGSRCQRQFADQWEAVAWLREHRPDLDLTSPPTARSNPQEDLAPIHPQADQPQHQQSPRRRPHRPGVG